MYSNWLVTLCKAPFMDKLQFIFADSSALFQVGFSLSWATQRGRGSTKQLPAETGGASEGSLRARSFLPDFPLSSLDDSSTQSFYLASRGWRAPPPPGSLLLWEPGRSQHGGYESGGKSMISGLLEGILLLKSLPGCYFYSLSIGFRSQDLLFVTSLVSYYLCSGVLAKVLWLLLFIFKNFYRREIRNTSFIDPGSQSWGQLVGKRGKWIWWNQKSVKVTLLGRHWVLHTDLSTENNTKEHGSEAKLGVSSRVNSPTY